MAKYKYQIIENADAEQLHGIYDNNPEGMMEEPENVGVMSAKDFPYWPQLMEKLENGQNPEQIMQELRSASLELDDEEVLEDSFIEPDIEKEERNIRDNLKRLNVKTFEDINSVQFLKIPENAMEKDRAIRNFLGREGISTSQLYMIACSRGGDPEKQFPLPENMPVILQENQRLIGFDREGLPHLVENTGKGLTQKTISRLKPGQQGKKQQTREDRMLSMIDYQEEKSLIHEEPDGEDVLQDDIVETDRENIIATMIELYHPELMLDMRQNVKTYGAAFDLVRGWTLDNMKTKQLVNFLSEEKNYREIEKKADNRDAKQLRKDIKEKRRSSASEIQLNKICEELYWYMNGKPGNQADKDDKQEYEEKVIRNTDVFKRFGKAEFAGNVELDGLILNHLYYPKPEVVQYVLKKEYLQAEKLHLRNIYENLKTSNDTSQEMKEICKCMKDLSDYSLSVSGRPDADVMRQKLGRLYQRYAIYMSEKEVSDGELEDVRLLLNNGKQKYSGTWEQIEKGKPVKQIAADGKNLLTGNMEQIRNDIRTAWESVKAQSIWLRGSKQYGDLYYKLEEFNEKIANNTVSENEMKDNIERIREASKIYLNMKVEGGNYKGNGSDVNKATAGVGERRFAAAEYVYKTMTEILNASRQNEPDKVQNEPENKPGLKELMVQWNLQMEAVKDKIPKESPLHQMAESVKKDLAGVMMAEEKNKAEIAAIVSLTKMQDQIANLEENLQTEDMKQMQKTLSEIQKTLEKNLSPEMKKEIEELEQMPLKTHMKARAKSVPHIQAKQQKTMEN